jgi:cytosine/adenosine deaminase-related metal-dependent hydrolase
LYRKFKADHLFTGHEILPGNNVLITTNDGVIVEIIDEKNAGDNIEIFHGILTPGFVNAHCHLELSHLKGIIPPATGLVDFVQQVMTKRASSENEKLQAIQKAEEELYNNGTLAVGDICNTADSVGVKQNSKIYWHNFIETSGFVDAVAEKRLEDMKKVFDQFQILNPKFKNSLSPHAPYSVSKTLFQLLNNQTNEQLITIHNQESAAENELYNHKQGDFLNLYKNFNIDISGFQPTGKSSLQSWFPYFTNNQSIILVHNTFINEDDIKFLQSQKLKIKNQFFCLCINANKYIEQKVPPINLLRENNCTIVIGTDSYASNWQLSVLDEIKTIQKETEQTIPLKEILKWATINGATALQIEDRFGSFEKGKKPGVVLIDEMNGLNITQDSFSGRII